MNALASSHAALRGQIKAAQGEPEDSLSYSNGCALCDAIDEFATILCKLAGGEDELKRRATLIATLCKSGTKYHAAMQTAEKLPASNDSSISEDGEGIKKLRGLAALPMSQYRQVSDALH